MWLCMQTNPKPLMRVAKRYRSFEGRLYGKKTWGTVTYALIGPHKLNQQ